MKQWILLLALVFVAMASARVAKHKKHREQALEVEPVEQEEVLEEPLRREHRPREHPCNTHECGVGEECILDKKEKAKCICIKKCGVEDDDRFKVCTKRNDTLASFCEMERQICLCKKGEDGCLNPYFRNAEIDYYGPCKDMDAEAKACTKYEKSQFPIRMRKWLFVVMEELAGRNDLSQKAMKLARKAEHMKESNKKDATHKWMIPVIWKFCDLDVSHDDIIAPLEHLPISAPLKPLEHCLSPFLQECDANNDENISKIEWLQCLKLEPEEIHMRCEEFRSDE